MLSPKPHRGEISDHLSRSDYKLSTGDKVKTAVVVAGLVFTVWTLISEFFFDFSFDRDKSKKDPSAGGFVLSKPFYETVFSDDFYEENDDAYICDSAVVDAVVYNNVCEKVADLMDKGASVKDTMDEIHKGTMSQLFKVCGEYFDTNEVFEWLKSSEHPLLPDYFADLAVEECSQRENDGKFDKCNGEDEISPADEYKKCAAEFGVKEDSDLYFLKSSCIFECEEDEDVCESQCSDMLTEVVEECGDNKGVSVDSPKQLCEYDVVKGFV